jgi:hypothetical protein
MKTTNPKRKLIAVIATIMLLTGFSAQANRKDTVAIAVKNNTCLELNGRITKVSNPSTNYYIAELIKGNDVVEVKVCSDKEPFRFTLQEGNYYAVKIKKVGYADKLISINTKLKKKEWKETRYQLYFRADLITENEYLVMDNDAKDFPIAVINYSDQNGYFDYSKEYTSNIKNAMLSGTKQSKQKARK